MFGSQVLNVAIGLSFVYLVLSLACAGLAEAVLRAIESRAKVLREGLVNLLDATKAQVDELYASPLLRGFRGRKGLLRVKGEGNDPTAIDTKTFALAVTSEFTGPVKAEELPEGSNVSPGELPVYETVRARVEALGDDLKVKRDALLALLDQAKGDLERWRKGVGDWFDASMREAGTWYKRQTQVILFVLSLGLCAVLNLDSVMMSGLLWQNTALRESIVEMAAGRDENEPQQMTNQRVANVRTQLSELGLIGWAHARPGATSREPRAVPDGVGPWLAKLAGLLMTALAATVGAPFWFNLVQTLLGLRSKMRGEPEKPASSTSG